MKNLIFLLPLMLLPIQSLNAAPLPNDGKVVTREYDSGALEKIQVENTSGKITVTPMEVDRVVISATKNKFSDLCTLTIDRSDITEIHAKVSGSEGSQCDVDFALKVPKDVALNLKTGSGDISLDKVNGPLTFEVGSGSLIANGGFKSVHGEVGSGNINVTGPVGGADVKAGSGSVELAFSQAPSQDVKVVTGSGSALLKFPDDAKFGTNLKAGSGSVQNDLDEADTPDFNVDVTTGSGSVQIQKF